MTFLSRLIRVVPWVALGLAAATCEPPPTLPPPLPIPDPPPRDFDTARAYPSLSEIYSGAQGIYRGCGPNGNVCHNSRQYPNMNTLGALSLNVNKPCNQLQDDPTRMDDWCERQGDTVIVGDTRLLLGYAQRLSDATDTVGSRWAIVTQEPIPTLTMGQSLTIVRPRAGGGDDWLMGFDFDELTVDPTRPNVLIGQVTAGDEYKEHVMAIAGIPAERSAIQFGDPNRNGFYGLTLGNGLIVAGHPEKSYIIRRLTDPSAGPLMPLANCCFWSKQSLRALWCWIANLHPDGANALDPIDYSVCPEGPVENVIYPEPGPTCENNGLCPVRTRDPVPDDPSWANIYANIIVPRCGGNGCHRSTSSPAGNLDLGTSDIAYDQLLHAATPRVIPGDPAMSMVYQRITQACAAGDTACRRMPLFQLALPDNEISLIQRWIQSGARMDGMLPVDAGFPDVLAPDAVTADVQGSDIVGMDTARPDVVTTDVQMNDVQMNDVQMNDVQMNDVQMDDVQMDDVQMDDVQMDDVQPD